MVLVCLIQCTKNGVRTDKYFSNDEEGQTKAARWVGYIFSSPLVLKRENRGNSSRYLLFPKFI